eukprot:GHVQ01013908.1.p1 GENE.GHVQ01013908.1~~GHVQ01013908.1.p1  ORF type:complete len:576 (+),score=47.04 GHVQ01013908.1:326-2053(+)
MTTVCEGMEGPCKYCHAPSKLSFSNLCDIPPAKFGLNVCGMSLVTQYVLLAVTGSFGFGYGMASLNTSKSFIGISFLWCPDDTNSAGSGNCYDFTLYSAFINVAVFIGAAGGCLAGGVVSVMGRRTSMMLMHGMFILGSVLSACSEGFMSLLLARLVVGVAVGFSTLCVPMFISEVTPKESRGFYGVFHQLGITIGILVAILFGLAFGEPHPVDEFVTLTTFQSVWWRLVVGFMAFVSIPALILFCVSYKVETPHFLMEHKKTVTATAFLRHIHNRENVSSEVNQLQQGIDEMRLLQQESMSLYAAIKNPSYRHVIIVGCVLSMFQQFTGINVLMANSNELYTAAGFGHLATYLSVGMTLLNVLMTFPPIFFVDRLGRRTLMLIGTAGQFLCLLPAMIASLVDSNSKASAYVGVAATFGYVVFFAIAYGPILWVYLHEIFPVEIKQRASAAASAVNWVATIVMVLPSEFLLSNDTTVIFSLFTVMGIVAFLIVYFFMKETKGLSIDNSPFFKEKSRCMPKSFSISMSGKSADDMERGLQELEGVKLSSSSRVKSVEDETYRPLKTVPTITHIEEY